MWRYAAHFTPVGAAITLRLGPKLTKKKIAVGVGVMLPIFLLFVPLLHYGWGLRWPHFRRLCRRYAAQFTAVGAAITLLLGPTLATFSPLV